VLDIGSGSGYLTHVMAELVGQEGTIVGIEHIMLLRDLDQMRGIWALLPLTVML
jgi:protein-L-isoaspartate(D-aspartate) O-methyltransferase